mgnify:CR=1 FL=1
MQKRRNITFAALPSADGKRSDAQDNGKLTLTIVVFLAPRLQVCGCHGVIIYNMITESRRELIGELCFAFFDPVV